MDEVKKLTEQDIGCRVVVYHPEHGERRGVFLGVLDEEYFSPTVIVRLDGDGLKLTSARLDCVTKD